ncbi:MAG: carbohydrate binding domain-containing protein, partial [Calditrichia bacterium]|nr:carbohydrate binding domain-containing protein [Calditrichia bacterium]
MSKYIILFIILLSAVVAAQDNFSIQIKNYSFELYDVNNNLDGWETGKNKSTAIENKNAQSGSACLIISHDNWHQSEIISDPVELQIGHLYKISAWVKSENAFTNPIDRYPTSVAACITMESFPFTNHSPTVGATKGWTKIEVEFIATKKADRIRLHFGFNGKAKGKVWFDNVELEKIEDISSYIPPETVK